MDPRLAEIYGTNEEVADVEKTAAAELAEKLASDEETNLDGMSDEDIEALAQEVLSSDEKTEEEAPAGDETEEKTASQEKLAEADYLGRVMAHAYVQELKNIEKAASAEEKEEKKEDKKDDKKLPPFMKKGDDKEKKASKSSKVEMMLKAKKGKDKKAEAAAEQTEELSAVDTLALERAREILTANGYELAETEAQPTEKQAASKEEQLANAVNARAIEMLKSQGYEFEE